MMTDSTTYFDHVYDTMKAKVLSTWGFEPFTSRKHNLAADAPE